MSPTSLPGGSGAGSLCDWIENRPFSDALLRRPHREMADGNRRQAVNIRPDWACPAKRRPVEATKECLPGRRPWDCTVSVVGRLSAGRCCRLPPPHPRARMAIRSACRTGHNLAASRSASTADGQVVPAGSNRDFRADTIGVGPAGARGDSSSSACRTKPAVKSPPADRPNHRDGCFPRARPEARAGGC